MEREKQYLEKNAWSRKIHLRKNNVSFPYLLPVTATWEAEDPLALRRRVKEVLTANDK